MRAVEYFLKQLQACLNGQTERIKVGSQSCNNAVQIQKARQQSRGYCVKYDFSIREGAPNHEYDKRGDDKYTVTCYVEHIRQKKLIYRNEKCIYRSEEDRMFSLIVEDLKTEKVEGTELISCPNCGAPATIQAIQNGCIYCGTHFEMSDIYPSATNYYAIYDFSMVEDRDKLKNPATAVGTYAKGYGKLFKMFTRVPQMISMVSRGGLSSKSTFESVMKKYTPDFSYQHFGATAINMMRMIIFSDDPSSLPFLAKENCPVISPNLIDFEFEGFGADSDGVVLNGKFIVAKVFIYVKSFYGKANEIAKINESYSATMSRDISKPVKMGFSYTKINCTSCGGVFDAYKSRNCPFCSTPYQFQETEWFITDIEKGR